MRSILELPRLGEEPTSPFPSTRSALASPNGLLAWGGDLAPARLLNAYRAGIFPWYSEGQPLLWWSPSPRCVLYPGEVYLSRRTRRRYNGGMFSLSLNCAFGAVIEGCAEPRPYEKSTWITADMIDAYLRMHELGCAHSLEVWRDDELVGGIYGLAIGSMFFGESMFGRYTDASKIALIALCKHLQRNGFGMMDCQVGNPHLFTMGAEEISRNRFERSLQRLIRSEPRDGCWQAGGVFDERW